MRRLLAVALLVGLGLSLSACGGPAGIAALSALSGVAGAAVGPFATRVIGEAEQGLDDAAAYRREQIERRRDFRALCHADLIAERAAYLTIAARQEDPNEAAKWFARAREVLAHAYPALDEISVLGERNMGLCGVEPIQTEKMASTPGGE